MSFNYLRSVLLCIVSIIFVLTLLGASQAGANSRVPDGSYKKSCKDMHVIGKMLQATCEDQKGVWRSTTIDMNRCEGDIRNDNGVLKCKQKAVKPPAGSYKKSCRNINVKGNRVYADCQRRDGSWNTSSINYKNCNRDISNDNGKLICGKANGGGKLPPGSYKNSCRNIYIEGKVLEADCKDDRGKWRHSSIKYKNCGKGLWNDNGKLRCNR